MIETHCKDCIFKVINDQGVQTGCAIGRSEKLPLKEKTEDGYFVLGRFCNTHRPSEWLESLSFEEAERSKEIVLEEVVPRFGFLIVLKTSNENCLKELESRFIDIVSQKHQARYVIVVTDKVEYNEGIQQLFTKYFIFEQTKHHIVQLLEIPENKNLIIDEASSHFLNGWLYVSYSDQIIKHDLLDKFNQLINYKMKQISIILPYDDFNGLVFQTALFKFLHGNKIVVKDETFDNRSFIEKAQAMQTSEQTIFSWKDVNES